MGKIRVAALGSQEEQELKEKQRVRREEKKKREGSEKVHISGMKGGERIKSVEADEGETEKMVKLAKQMEKQEQPSGNIAAQPASAKSPSDKKEKFKKRSTSKRYQELRAKVDPTKQYILSEALVLLREISFAKFDSTIELHLNTLEKGLRGTVQLPHGTGKAIRVAIADPATIDALIEKVQKGVIDFDTLVAHPAVMPKLAKIAKFLGPRGLMPNPKNGTISATPEKVAGKLKGGEINWKTESAFPIIHQIVGKLSFADPQLEENISAFILSVGKAKIKNITLKSTMSPGIRLQHQAA